MANMFEIMARIGLDTTAFSKGIATAGKALKGLTEGAEKVSVAIGKGIVDANVKAVKALGDFAKSSVEVGKQFDKSMSQVASTMGKTVDEMNKEIVEKVKLPSGEEFTGNLTEFAKKMGRETAFSATESAEALNYMALAGYDAEKSMRMLPSVLNLAAAGQMDLANASDMVTDASSALGLNEEQTAQMIDKMAMASSKSNTSVSQLGNAFLAIGGTAKNLKGGTTELATTLGILADNGVKGAEGGIALRNVLKNLTSPTEAGANKLKELGIEVYDAEGNMRSMKDIMTELSKSLDGLTTQERMDAMNTIFDARTLKSANALIGTSADRWDALAGAIDDSAGSAQKMAETQLDNLAGDITLFKSALEAVQISISDGLSPTLRTFVQLGTEGLSSISSALENGDFSGAFSAIADTLFKGVAEVSKISPEIVNAVSAIIKALLTNIVENKDNFKENFLTLFSVAKDALIELAPLLVETFSTQFSTIVETLSELIPEILPFVTELLEALGQAVMDNLPTMLESLEGLGENLGEFLMQLFEDLSEVDWGFLANQIIQFLTEAFGNLDMAENGVSFITKFFESITENTEEILRGVSVFLGLLVKSLIDALPALLEGAVAIINGLMGFIMENLGPLIQAGITILDYIIDGLIENLPAIIEGVNELIIGFTTAITDNLPAILNAGIDLVFALVDGLIENLPELLAAGMQLIMGIVEAIAKGLPGILEAGADIVVKLAGGIFSSIWKLGPALVDIWNTIKDYFTGGEIFQKMEDWGGDMIQGLVDGIKNMIGKVTGAITDVANSIKELIHFSRPDKGPLREYEKWMPDFMKGLAKGIKGSEGLVTSAISDLSDKMVVTPTISDMPIDDIDSLATPLVAKVSKNYNESANGDYRVYQTPISINIENFTNNDSTKDVDNLVNIISQKLARELSRQKQAFA